MVRLLKNQLSCLLLLMLAGTQSNAGTVVRLNIQQGIVDDGVYLKLYDSDKPFTVSNFKSYINDGSYENSLIHRSIPGFVIQGGCPFGNGTSGPGYQFKDEFDSSLRHSGEGVFSMANAGPGTNGSQFFITLAATPHLNDRHSVFGKVIKGIEVIRKIGAVDTDGNDKPLEPVVMNSVTIRR